MPTKIAIVALSLACASRAAAEEASKTNEFHPFAVGAQLSLDIAWQAYDPGSLPYYSPPDPKPRFAGGGSAHFDFCPVRIIALEAGIGFIGKGCRNEGHALDEAEETRWTRVTYLEIPLGAKLDLGGGRARRLNSRHSFLGVPHTEAIVP